MQQTYRPPTPDVRDGHARALLWVIFTATMINMIMVGYMFLVVHNAVDALRHFGDAFTQ